MTQNYPRIAFCSAITAPSREHYLKMKKDGISTVSVCLHVSDYEHEHLADLHTTTAREVGMATHAYMVTDLYEPEKDVASFLVEFLRLGFTSDSKITVLVNSDEFLEEKEERILRVYQKLCAYCPMQNIDLAFYKHEIDTCAYDLKKLPKVNLTIINCDNLAQKSGIEKAGTWLYTATYGEVTQTLAYDFRGFYTSGGYQLSLTESTYVVQPGDTWYSIAERHGMEVVDLLALNRESMEKPIWAGQTIYIS